MMSEEKLHSIGKKALFLALTSSKPEEDALKKRLFEEGYSCAVTGAGGNVTEMKQKIVSAVIGACLNNNVINKQPEEMHALIHACIEAKEGMLLGAPSSSNMAVKIAAVRYEKWLAVAIYGHFAMHTMTNHETSGLGIMHI
ncbi:MAG: HutP family protein [Peptococcaceae bacterium]|jgi:hut operon positive regulator|nr:HutP family protein [Peptococcaceae bacterium]MDH7525601.1 HutP family protein [Peptococcaceae bacterium]